MSAPQTNPDVPVIQMKDATAVSSKNPGAPALEQVNWSVAAGDYWVVAGLHGSGKSDLLMLTAGLTSPRRGTYRLFGEPMPIFEEARLPTRLRLGLVFDGGQLFNRLTVADNVAVPLCYHRDLTFEAARDEVTAILEATELMTWANSLPGAMPRNWQRRAGLARALALRPELLLFDNPLGGLDLRHTAWWLNFLDQLAAGHALMKGRPTTLVVTADHLHPWRERARQFAVIRDNRFVPLGSRAALTGDTDSLVKELLAGTTTNV